MRSAPVAYLLWLPCAAGVCGLHRLYAGRYASGVLWLVTFGLCGMGQLADLLLIPGMVTDKNWRSGRDARCPRCRSAHLRSDREGFRGGQAAVGAVLLGPLGLLAGTAGSKGVVMSCLKCGKKWPV